MVNSFMTFKTANLTVKTSYLQNHSAKTPYYSSLVLNAHDHPEKHARRVKFRPELIFDLQKSENDRQIVFLRNRSANAVSLVSLS